MEYPKEYKKCPICGCKERVVENEANAEKRKGKIAQERQATSQTSMLPIMDPIAGSQISAPVLFVYKDICERCGFEYPHVITRQEMPTHQILAMLGQSIPFKLGKNPGT